MSMIGYFCRLPPAWEAVIRPYRRDAHEVVLLAIQSRPESGLSRKILSRQISINLRR